MVPDIFSSALSFKSKTDDGDEEVDEEGENGDEEDIDSDPKDEYVPTEADINVIIQLVRVTREKAFQALVDTDGDLLAAAQKIHNNT
jgi:NACalpha-BTF3-like transcription factor